MLSLYTPKLEDLWFRQSIMSDPETMSYNQRWGGTIPFPKEKWEVWYGRWVGCAEGTRFYRYLLDTERDEWVGEAAYRYDDERGVYICDIIVRADYRGMGYGKAGLELLCKCAKENGVTALYDDIAADNPSVALFLKCGFAVEYRNDDFVMVKKEL